MDFHYFLKDDQYVENRIVYYTSSLQNNDEVTYYLKPFMEDFNHDIYYVENIELEKNKLEVYKDGNLVKSTDKKKLDSFSSL